MSALDDIRQRTEAATEGPWEARIGAYSSEGGNYSGGYIPEVCEEGHDGDGYYAPLTEEDAEFIAHARTDIPRLLGALDAVLAAHAACYGGRGCETTRAVNDALKADK